MASMRQYPCEPQRCITIYVASHKDDDTSQQRKDTTMTNRKILSAIGDLFTTFGSAVAASRSVEAGRRPRADDLRKLGMDPAVFNRIGRF